MKMRDLSMEETGSGGPTHFDDAGSQEGNYDSDHVDRELELEELSDAVVDVPAPHDSLHNTCEVVVCQDDVGSLLGYIRTSNALA